MTGNDGAAAQAQVAGETQAQGDQAARQQAAVTAGLQGASAAGDGGDAVAQAHKDYETALAERDARIAELEGEIAVAAKTAEGAEKLRAEMDELRRRGDEEHVGFEPQLAGAQREGRPRPSCRPRRRHREDQGRGALALLGARRPGAGRRDGTAERGRRWGRRVDADEPLAQDRRPSRERGVNMANSIAYTKNYTAVLDEVYKRAACSTCLNSPRRMARAGRNAKEIMVPKIEVTGLGDYTRNVGYKTGSITYEFETKTFNYDRGIRLLVAKKLLYAIE